MYWELVRADHSNRGWELGYQYPQTEVGVAMWLRPGGAFAIPEEGAHVSFAKFIGGV